MNFATRFLTGEQKMKKVVKNFINNSYQILRDKEEFDMVISQVLSFKNGDGTTGFQAIAVSQSDPDEIRCICENIQAKTEYQKVPSWGYNIEDYLLDDLENGFEIEFMTLDEHCGIWYTIDNWHDDIFHMEGLQKYLYYCQQNEITAQVISLYSSEHIDISDLYQEANGPYKIIAETSIGSRAIVLGHSSISPSPYVTWDTTPNRKHGYYGGHYFSSYTDAFKDYKERCQVIMSKHLEFERNKTKPNKVKKEYER